MIVGQMPTRQPFADALGALVAEYADVDPTELMSAIDDQTLVLKRRQIARWIARWEES